MTVPRRHTALHPNAVPRGFRREAAAEYVCVGTTKFDEMVADGRMPRAIKVDGCAIWDRVALDKAFDRLTGCEVNPWD
jgi:hypothetical protein